VVATFNLIAVLELCINKLSLLWKQHIKISNYSKAGQLGHNKLTKIENTPTNLCQHEIIRFWAYGVFRVPTSNPCKQCNSLNTPKRKINTAMKLPSNHICMSRCSVCQNWSFPSGPSPSASTSLVSIFEQSAPHRNKRVLLLSVQLSGWPIFNGMPGTLGAFISSPSGLCSFLCAIVAWTLATRDDERLHAFDLKGHLRNSRWE
jgi:hypothetical protein